MNTCDTIQQRLAEEGAAALRDDADARRHLEGCADCRELRDRLRELDQAFGQLPPHDAPDALVERTLAAVRRAPRGGVGSPWATANRRIIAGVLAASVVFAAGLGVIRTILPIESLEIVSDEGSASAPSRVVDQLAKRQSPELMAVPSPSVGQTAGTARATSQGQDDELSTATETIGGERLKLDLAENRPSESLFEQNFADGPLAREGDDLYLREARTLALLEGRLSRGAPEGEPAEFGRDKEAKRKRSEETDSLRRENFSLSSNERRTLRDSPQSQVRGQGEADAMPRNDQLMGGDAEPSDDKNRELGDRAPELGNKGAVRAPSALDPDGAGAAGELSAAPETESPSPAAPRYYGEHRGDRRSEDLGADRPRGLARDFLAQLRSLDGLSYQPATGYWSNTYLPGDPDMRLLQVRLRDWNRARFGQEVRLEQAVRPVAQPFDAPEDAALALYLHGDTQAIQGPTRLRLQVGIKGAERQGGRRPAMNLGLVVDLRDPPDPAMAGRLRALILALERARQPGDRFSLTVAGPGGGLLVAPERFKHGPLSVAMNQLFGETTGVETAMIGLQDAVTLASRNVRAGDDPSAVLGTSLVLLATGAAVDRDLAILEEIAHVNAVSGVPMSVVGLGGASDLDHLDRLAAAGQGSRRILSSAEEAEALVDRELHGASRAVARALRLRIRLAPGVRLVEILGSRRLEDPQSQRVREAEQALDRRLARNLGIQADRGQDEEGIQIVIPNFYAGDAHVVLLDVLAERPGPIADVTLRYKDVVYLRNGVARAGFSLRNAATVQGPLERNVLKNRVAWELSRQTRLASRALAAGQAEPARQRLAVLRDLIRGLRLEVAGWSADPDLAADEALLGEYLTVLSSPAMGDGVQRRYLSQSLRYLAYRKLQSAAR